MNNVQFITWKPIYWIQHLALSPIPSIFQHSRWKKKKRKERKSVFNSQSCLWIVLCTGSPRCKHRFFFFCQITTTTFTYLLLRARFLHVLRLSLCVSCFLETLSMLLLILSRHGNIWGRDSNASKDRKWLACQKKKKKKKTLTTVVQNIAEQHWRYTITVQEHNNGSKTVSPSFLKEAAIVMLNISSADWERSSEGLGRECHPRRALVKPAHSMKFWDIFFFFSATWEEKRRRKGRSSLLIVRYDNPCGRVNQDV